jgi:hypothetical protein
MFCILRRAISYLLPPRPSILQEQHHPPDSIFLLWGASNRVKITWRIAIGSRYNEAGASRKINVFGEIRHSENRCSDPASIKISPCIWITRLMLNHLCSVWVYTRQLQFNILISLKVLLVMTFEFSKSWNKTAAMWFALKWFLPKPACSQYVEVIWTFNSHRCQSASCSCITWKSKEVQSRSFILLHVSGWDAF